MNHDELDRLLSREQEIIPSSGFTSSVMNAVHAQAQAPPPIPFPWKRALPGMAAAVVSLAWILFACLRVLSAKSGGDSLAMGIPPAFLSLWHVASWLLIALFVSVVCLAFSFRFVSRAT